MDRMLHDQQFYKHNVSKHKMTTLKQYSLLKRKMATLMQSHKSCYKNNNANGILRYKQNNKFWAELTDELNNLGPPYRTVQQWKKVWCDFKRGQKKRGINSSHSKVIQEEQQNYDNEIVETEITEIHVKSEPEDNEHNNFSSSICTSFGNEYDNDYSYPDEDSFQESYNEERESFIPDESSCGSYSYLNKPALRKSNGQQSANKHFASPPPFQPSNADMLGQTMYTLQNQMENQTKLLENLFNMSTSMVHLMERQVDAVEKQTEVIHRQALAKERHTSVMNDFIDMIREKMLKENS